MASTSEDSSYQCETDDDMKQISTSISTRYDDFVKGGTRLREICGVKAGVSYRAFTDRWYRMMLKIARHGIEVVTSLDDKQLELVFSNVKAAADADIANPFLMRANDQIGVPQHDVKSLLWSQRAMDDAREHLKAKIPSANVAECAYDNPGMFSFIMHKGWKVLVGVNGDVKRYYPVGLVSTKPLRREEIKLDNGYVTTVPISHFSQQSYSSADEAVVGLVTSRENAAVGGVGYGESLHERIRSGGWSAHYPVSWYLRFLLLLEIHSVNARCDALHARASREVVVQALCTYLYGLRARQLSAGAARCAGRLTRERLLTALTSLSKAATLSDVIIVGLDDWASVVMRPADTYWDYANGFTVPVTTKKRVNLPETEANIRQMHADGARGKAEVVDATETTRALLYLTQSGRPAVEPDTPVGILRRLEWCFSAVVSFPDIAHGQRIAAELLQQPFCHGWRVTKKMQGAMNQIGMYLVTAKQHQRIMHSLEEVVVHESPDLASYVKKVTVPAHVGDEAGQRSFCGVMEEKNFSAAAAKALVNIEEYSKTMRRVVEALVSEKPDPGDILSCHAKAQFFAYTQRAAFLGYPHTDKNVQVVKVTSRVSIHARDPTVTFKGDEYGAVLEEALSRLAPTPAGMDGLRSLANDRSPGAACVGVKPKSDVKISIRSGTTTEERLVATSDTDVWVKTKRAVIAVGGDRIVSGEQLQHIGTPDIPLTIGRRDDVNKWPCRWIFVVPISLLYIQLALREAMYVEQRQHDYYRNATTKANKLSALWQLLQNVTDATRSMFSEITRILLELADYPAWDLHCYLFVEKLSHLFAKSGSYSEFRAAVDAHGYSLGKAAAIYYGLAALKLKWYKHSDGDSDPFLVAISTVTSGDATTTTGNSLGHMCIMQLTAKVMARELALGRLNIQAAHYDLDRAGVFGDDGYKTVSLTKKPGASWDDAYADAIATSIAAAKLAGFEVDMADMAGYHLYGCFLMYFFVMCWLLHRTRQAESEKRKYSFSPADLCEKAIGALLSGQSQKAYEYWLYCSALVRDTSEGVERVHDINSLLAPTGSAKAIGVYPFIFNPKINGHLLHIYNVMPARVPVHIVPISISRDVGEAMLVEAQLIGKSYGSKVSGSVEDMLPSIDNRKGILDEDRTAACVSGLRSLSTFPKSTQKTLLASAYINHPRVALEETIGERTKELETTRHVFSTQLLSHETMQDVALPLNVPVYGKVYLRVSPHAVFDIFLDQGFVVITRGNTVVVRRELLEPIIPSTEPLVLLQMVMGMTKRPDKPAYNTSEFMTQGRLGSLSVKTVIELLRKCTSSEQISTVLNVLGFTASERTKILGLSPAGVILALEVAELETLCSSPFDDFPLSCYLPYSILAAPFNVGGVLSGIGDVSSLPDPKAEIALFGFLCRYMRALMSNALLIGLTHMCDNESSIRTKSFELSFSQITQLKRFRIASVPAVGIGA